MFKLLGEKTTDKKKKKNQLKNIVLSAKLASS